MRHYLTLTWPQNAWNPIFEDLNCKQFCCKQHWLWQFWNLKSFTLFKIWFPFLRSAHVFIFFPYKVRDVYVQMVRMLLSLLNSANLLFQLFWDNCERHWWTQQVLEVVKDCRSVDYCVWLFACSDKVRTCSWRCDNLVMLFTPRMFVWQCAVSSTPLFACKRVSVSFQAVLSGNVQDTEEKSNEEKKIEWEARLKSSCVPN